MKRCKGTFIALLLGLLVAGVYVIGGCDNSSTEDTGNVSDTTAEDTGTGGDTGTTDSGGNESVVHKSGESITNSQKWSGTHTLEGNLYIKASVEITPCTKILIAPGAKISISDSGSIKSIGTKECPVIFTSSKSSKAKGDWNLIEIYEKSSSDNAFEWTILEYGGSGDYGLLWIDGNASVKIENTTFSNSKSYGLYFDSDAKITGFTGNKFNDIDLNPIFISANEVGALNSIETSNNAQNTVLVNGGAVTNAAKWKNIGVPYFIKQNLSIKAAVEIEAGNTMIMGNGVKISVSDSGSIKAAGTKESPIIFTSSKSSKSAGDWRLIEIYNTASSDNSFEYTTLEFGGDGDYGLLWIDENVNVSINNSVFKDSSSYGIYFENGAVLKSFSQNNLSNIALNPISIEANDVIKLDKFTTANNPKNTVLIRGGSTDKAGTWKNIGIPYENKNNVYFKSDIEVEAGTVFLMAPNTKFTISDSGSLRLKGTQNENITIKSAKSSPAAGDWYEIDIYGTANNNNIWDYVNVSHGGGNDYGQVWVDDGASLTLNNCKFADGKGCDVYLENGGTLNNNNSTYKLCQQ